MKEVDQLIEYWFKEDVIRSGSPHRPAKDSKVVARPFLHPKRKKQKNRKTTTDLLLSLRRQAESLEMEMKDLRRKKELEGCAASQHDAWKLVTFKLKKDIAYKLRERKKYADLLREIDAVTRLLRELTHQSMRLNDPSCSSFDDQLAPWTNTTHISWDKLRSNINLQFSVCASIIDMSDEECGTDSLSIKELDEDALRIRHRWNESILYPFEKREVASAAWKIINCSFNGKACQKIPLAMNEMIGILTVTLDIQEVPVRLECYFMCACREINKNVWICSQLMANIPGNHAVFDRLGGSESCATLQIHEESYLKIRDIRSDVTSVSCSEPATRYISHTAVCVSPQEVSLQIGKSWSKEKILRNMELFAKKYELMIRELHSMLCLQIENYLLDNSRKQ